MNMSKSQPITPKEKMLVGVLTKLYSKERLNEEFDDVTKYGDGASSLVIGAGKLIGIGKRELNELAQQYLNYSIKNYDKIKNNEFPEHIDRVKEVILFGNEVEKVYKINRTRTRLMILPETLDKCLDHVSNNIWEFDTDTEDYDYGDTDFISFELIPEYTEVHESPKNSVLN